MLVWNEETKSSTKEEKGKEGQLGKEEEASNKVFLNFSISNSFSNSTLLETMIVLTFTLVINLDMLLG